MYVTNTEVILGCSIDSSVSLSSILFAVLKGRLCAERVTFVRSFVRQRTKEKPTMHIRDVHLFPQLKGGSYEQKEFVAMLVSKVKKAKLTIKALTQHETSRS